MTESMLMIWAQLLEGQTWRKVDYLDVYVKLNAVNSFHLSQFFGEFLTLESFG